MYTSHEVLQALLAAIVSNARKAEGQGTMLTPAGALDHAKAARELAEVVHTFGWSLPQPDQS